MSAPGKSMTVDGMFQSYSANQTSKFFNTKRPSPAPAPSENKSVVKKRRPIGEEDMSAESSDDFSDGSDFEDGFLNSRDKQEKALYFFNHAKEGTLVELTKCSPDKAKLLIELRPFKTIDDFRTRTRKTKGLGNNLMDDYLELMKGLEDVDDILDQCEAFGQKIDHVLEEWTAAAATAGGENQGKEKSGGYKLVHVPEKKETHEGSEAFKDFLYAQPSIMDEKMALKEYQIMGINWMNLLYRNGTSCILADEMGLGKTAQVIGFLSYLKEKGQKGPHLVIVPSSTLENWLREFDVFSPELSVFSYYGSQAERYELRHELKGLLRSDDEDDEINVVVTTYNIATGHDDLKFLCKKLSFDCCVFDEGHQLKNSESKKYKDLMRIQPRWRVLLTGTPLQNNLQELISLLSFILPEQFRHADESLKSIFKLSPGASSHLLLSNERIKRARQMMMPFCLRRKKSEVLFHLPSKTEKVLWCEMTAVQREIYNDALSRSRRVLEHANVRALALESSGDDSDDLEKPKSGRNTKAPTEASTGANILSDLRKSCNHPMLFRRLYTDDLLRKVAKDCLKELEFADSNPEYVFEDLQVMNDLELHRFCLRYEHVRPYALQNNEWMDSGKVHVLVSLLEQAKREGNRILLFSQFTQVLDILELVLDTLGLKYVILTGQTSVVERQGIVDDFTHNEELSVFLLSTRAGGLGLNLTASNTVVFYDQDFNPHNDRQAEDRSYRIGQTRDVTIYKLIMKDTLEEDMRALATGKLLLDRTVSENAGGEDSEEVASANVALFEKKMRMSLLSSLKRGVKGVKAEEEIEKKADEIASV